MQSVEVYIHRSSPTLRVIVVSVFTKSDGEKNASSISSSETFAKRRVIFQINGTRLTANVLFVKNRNFHKLSAFSEKIRKAG